MEKKLLFSMPEDFMFRARLLGLVPKDWLIDGELHAPEQLVVDGKALANTGLRLEKHHPPQIIGLDHVARRGQKPDLRGLRHSYYSFARFYEAGGHNYPAFETATEQAGIMLELGFEGDLHFYMECLTSPCRCRRVMHCSMLFLPHSTVEIKWDSACSNAFSLMDTLSKAFRKEGLCEQREKVALDAA